MAFKLSSLLVWLLATSSPMTMTLQKVSAQTGCDEEVACAADAVCGECLAVGETFNQVYEDCVDTELPLGGSLSCGSSLRMACCQHLGSANDCLASGLFVEAWWCTIKACPDFAYPSVEACASLGISLNSGGGSGSVAVESPAPTAAAGNHLQQFHQ